MSGVVSRKVNSTKSIVSALIQNIIRIIIQFVFRSVFIYYLSVDYLGVNSAIAGVLNFLSLTELGLSSVITFNLYKPIAEGDQNKVNSIVALYRKFYMFIGLAILIIGLGLVFFLDYLVKDVAIVGINIRVVYLLSLLSTVFTYFCSYRYVLFVAYQEQYKANIINTILNSLTVVTQIIVILLTRNYYAYLVTQFALTIVSNVILHICTLRFYPQVDVKNATPLDAETKRIIGKNVKGMVYHKISYSVLQGTDSVIISSFIGATILGLYSNYTIFTSSLTMIFALISSSLAGSIGNLIAEGDSEKSYAIYKTLKLVFFWFSGFVSICLFVLLNPAIELWAILGKWDPSISWTFDIGTVLVITLNFYLYSSRVITGSFREGVGNFDKDRYKGVIEALINLVASIILVNYLGIAGVLVGTIISCVCTSLWVDPYMVYKYHFKKPLRNHFIEISFYTIVTIIAGVTSYFVSSLFVGNSIWSFLLKILVCIVIPNIIFLIFYGRTKEFKNLYDFLKNFIKSLQRRSCQDGAISADCIESEAMTNSSKETDIN